jgi:mono/diheme cytochrome c family protein
MKKQKKQQKGPPVQSLPTSESKGGLAPVRVKEVDEEPTASRYSVPAVFVAILGALLYWGNMYIVEYGGELDARVYYPYKTAKELQDMVPKDETAIAKMKGQAVYGRICAACHQSDGNGGASQNAPPLAGSEWVLAKDPARIIRIVLHGLQGTISVKGKEWGQGVMLPWRDVLNDEDAAMVLTFVRNSWGNKAPAVTPEQVKKARGETKDWSTYMTVQELLKVSLQE